MCRTPWTTTELAELRALTRRGVRIRFIIRRLGRTYASVETALRRQRALAPAAVPRRLLRWSEDELLRLQQLIDAGLTYRAISQRLRRSYDSVRKKATSRCGPRGDHPGTARR